MDSEGGSGGGSGRPLDHELDLMRALAHAKLGERERARELMAAAAHAEGELALSLRAELQRALEGVERRRARALELQPPAFLSSCSTSFATALSVSKTPERPAARSPRTPALPSG